MPALGTRNIAGVNAVLAREEAPTEDTRPPVSALGQIPLLALLAALGLLICTGADALARATLAPSPLIYWAGILVIGLPIFYRLLAGEMRDGERLFLVCLLGLALYGVKLARDSFLFTFPDEFIHAFNADQIASQHELFGSNPLQPISTDYPGLEGAASALMTMTGISSFGAGIVMIGAARLALVTGLFLLFRRVSGSSRLAGVAAAVYAGSSNFLLWGVQFSYQSLALPLLVVVLVAVSERESAPRDWGPAWVLPIGLLIAAIVVTHHLTSYALAVILALLSLLYWVRDRRLGWPNPWPYALAAAGAAAAWLFLVAGATVDYLGPVLSRAFHSTVDTVTGEANARALFEGTAAVQTVGLGNTPAAARIVALASVAILVAGLPFGLWQVWRRHRAQPLALLFCVAAIGFFGVLALRFAPAAWETSNRAGEFLFIGLAFVVAFAGMLGYLWLNHKVPRSAAWLSPALLTALFGVVLVGGAISGWPYNAQLASPLRAEAHGRTIESEPVGLARWVEKHVPGGGFAAAEADARTLLSPGRQRARTGKTPDITTLIKRTKLESFVVPLLRSRNLRYVVADRRRIASNTIYGYRFSLLPPAGVPDILLPGASVLKFEQIPTAARLMDSGNIVLYDVEGRR